MKALSLTAALLGAIPTVTQAASLQVSPVIVEVPPPAVASFLRLRNPGLAPITAQVRIYRWSQHGGADRLVETRDVVASPPLADIAAQSAQIVRIVRVSGTPLQGEESYRILIDEIPEPKAGASAVKGVQFAVRYSIPAFFTGTARAPAPLQWSIEQKGEQVSVTATNPGDRRVRLAALRLAGPHGDLRPFGDGLAGYVLSGTSARWSLKALRPLAEPGGTIAISADTDNGPLHATATVRMPR